MAEGSGEGPDLASGSRTVEGPHMLTVSGVSGRRVRAEPLLASYGWLVIQLKFGSSSVDEGNF